MNTYPILLEAGPSLSKRGSDGWIHPKTVLIATRTLRQRLGPVVKVSQLLSLEHDDRIRLVDLCRLLRMSGLDDDDTAELERLVERATRPGVFKGQQPELSPERGGG